MANTESDNAQRQQRRRVMASLMRHQWEVKWHSLSAEEVCIFL